MLLPVTATSAAQVSDRCKSARPNSLVASRGWVNAQTARKYYLDAKTAFGGNDLLKKMAIILRPQESRLGREIRTARDQ